jgi:hypothetical protein
METIVKLSQDDDLEDLMIQSLMQQKPMLK